MNTSEDMEKRYVAALEKQLQEEKMVTFKLSQQIEKKDAALKECLKFFESEGMDGMKQTVKDALDR